MSHEHILTVDGREVVVPAGATVLDAARKLGISIPTLCQADGLPPGTSCMVCVVEIEGIHRLVPSCAYPATAGLAIRTNTPAVQAVRRAAVELLMSEHTGDCEGPCRRACPANMDIPLMIRHLAAGHPAAALATVLRDIALPSILGRICPAPCEKACRRARIDKPVSICLLKRFSGDHGPRETPAAPASGRRVAIAGAGPAGLSAAFFLRRLGHTCEIFEERALPGGTLRDSIPGNRLPPDVLDREIESLRQTGVILHTGKALGRDVSLADLRAGFDAVILAIGIASVGKAMSLGIPVTDKGIEADRHTYLTPLRGVFAIGSVLRPLKMAVRAGADGKECALACDQFLRQLTVKGEPKRFNCVISNVTPPELQEMLRLVSRNDRVEPDAGLTAGLSGEATTAEARRCLHCDCRKAADCRLRDAVEQLGADARNYAGSGRHLIELMDHPNGLMFEPGKCIKCGLCIRKARSFSDVPGLTFIRRGYQSRVSPPTGETFVTAMGNHAAAIVAVCPTGALTLEKP